MIKFTVSIVLTYFTWIASIILLVANLLWMLVREHTLVSWWWVIGLICMAIITAILSIVFMIRQ